MWELARRMAAPAEFILALVAWFWGAYALGGWPLIGAWLAASGLAVTLAMRAGKWGQN